MTSPQQHPGYSPYVPPQNSSKATTSLVLGIVSLVACGLFLGIPAMIVGRQAKREIAASQGRLAGEGLATAGFWTGLIATVLSGLGFVFVILVFVFGGIIASSFEQTCSTLDGNTSGSVSCS